MKIRAFFCCEPVGSAGEGDRISANDSCLTTKAGAFAGSRSLRLEDGHENPHRSRHLRSCLDDWRCLATGPGDAATPDCQLARASLLGTACQNLGGPRDGNRSGRFELLPYALYRSDSLPGRGYAPLWRRLRSRRDEELRYGWWHAPVRQRIPCRHRGRFTEHNSDADRRDRVRDSVSGVLTFAGRGHSDLDRGEPDALERRGRSCRIRRHRTPPASTSMPLR